MQIKTVRDPTMSEPQEIVPIGKNDLVGAVAQLQQEEQRVTSYEL